MRNVGLGNAPLPSATATHEGDFHVMKGIFTLCLGLVLLPSTALAQAPAYFAQWGGLGSGDGNFKDPYDVALVPGFMYVVDSFNHRVQKLTADGMFVLKWGSQGTANGQFQQDLSVAVDPSGNVYVSDNANHRIQKFTSVGVFLLKWGTMGTAAGQFQYPRGVAVDAASNVYVCDRNNHRVQKFTSQGAFIRQWGSLGTSPGKFQFPGAVAVNSSGQVYVTDDANRVQRFDSNGVFLSQFGSEGEGNGQFFGPAGVAVDPLDGSVYVSDNLNARIQKFTATGTFIVTWGTAGRGAGQFDAPRGLDVDNKHNIYVADTNNDRIQKFVYSVTGLPSEDPIASTHLLRAVPNPARGNVGVNIELPEAMVASARHVEAQVFDVTGRLVENIHREAANGRRMIRWEPKGGSIPAGLYMIRVMIDGSSIGAAKVLRVTR